jgi:transposase-like protein
MVLDHEAEYPSRWAAIASIAAKIGCTAQTLLEWVKRAEVESGKRAGVPTDMTEKLKALERENRELGHVRHVWMPPAGQGG